MTSPPAAQKRTNLQTTTLPLPAATPPRNEPPPPRTQKTQNNPSSSPPLSPSPSSSSSVSSVLSSSSSSADADSDSDSTSGAETEPTAPPVSLQTRLRSFLPRLAAANASLAESNALGGANAGEGFELESVPVDEDGRDVGSEEDEKERGEGEGDKDEAEGKGMYIEMDLGLGVLEAVPDKGKDGLKISPSSSGEVPNATATPAEEPAIMEDLLGKKPSKKSRKVGISEVE